MQVVFGIIDEQTAAAAPQVNRGAYFRAVIRMIEVAHWAFNKRALDEVLGRPDSPPTLQQLSYVERKIRDVLDIGLIILNSSAARQNTTSAVAIGNSELNRLMELAFSYEEMRQCYDLYTYGFAKVKVKRKSIVFTNIDKQADAAGAVSAERIQDKDQSRRALLLGFEAALRKAFTHTPSLMNRISISFSPVPRVL